jgi:hypothetical protein
MNVTKPCKPRQRQLKPATGAVRLVRPIGAVNESTGEVVISGKSYYLSWHATGFRLTGYDERHQAVTVYDIPSDLSSCDCPDATYNPERPGGCKHRKALVALRQAQRI